jgi:dimethylargininase
VLAVGKRVWIGRSQRTDSEGIRQFTELVTRFGYHVQAVDVSQCLHLKSAVTQVGHDTLLHNPMWCGAEMLGGFFLIETHPTEPAAANALLAGPSVLLAASHPRTRERLEARGITVVQVEMDELAKAEAGLTCCSILVPPATV